MWAWDSRGGRAFLVDDDYCGIVAQCRPFVEALLVIKITREFSAANWMVAVIAQLTT